MNKVIILGRLTADPEIRYTQAGKAVASLTIAVNRGFGSDSADFINCVAWEKLAEIIGNNLSKGGQVLVEGRMQNRSYENNQGEKRFVTEVVLNNIEFVGSKKTSEPSIADDMGEVVPNEQIPF